MSQRTESVDVVANNRRAIGGWQKIADNDVLVSVGAFVLLLLAWQLSVIYFKIPNFILPTPTAIATSLYQGFASGLFVYNFAVTAFQTIIGFLLAAFVGVSVGTLVSQFRILEKTVLPWIVALQTLPKIAIAPLIIIWAGYGIESKIIIVALVALFPVLVNTIAGMNSCDQGKLDLMRALRASRWETFHMVQLPNALPFIFAGLDVAIVLSILGAIVGEFVGSRAGLGNLILEANFQFNIAEVFAILVVLGIFGVVLSWIVRSIQRRLLFWNRTSKSSAS